MRLKSLPPTGLLRLRRLFLLSFGLEVDEDYRPKDTLIFERFFLISFIKDRPFEQA